MIGTEHTAFPGSTVVRATNGLVRWPETVMRTAATVTTCSAGKWYTYIPDVYACLALQLRGEELPGEGQVCDLLRQDEEMYGDVQDVGEGHFLWFVHPWIFRAPPQLCPLCHAERSAHNICSGKQHGEPCGRPVCAAPSPLCCLCQNATADMSQQAASAAAAVPLIDENTLPLLLPDLLAIKDRELAELRVEMQLLKKLLRFVEEHDMSRLLVLTEEELRLVYPVIVRLVQQQQQQLKDRCSTLQMQRQELLEIQEELARAPEPAQEGGEPT